MALYVNTMMTDGGSSSKINKPISVPKKNTVAPNNNTSSVSNSGISSTTSPTTNTSKPATNNVSPTTNTSSVTPSVAVPVDTFNYKELKQNITKIINYLEKASNSLSLPINNLDSYYVIDKKKSVIQERMENLRSEMNKTKNYLKDNVINEINQKL